LLRGTRRSNSSGRRKDGRAEVFSYRRTSCRGHAMPSLAPPQRDSHPLFRLVKKPRPLRTVTSSICPIILQDFAVAVSLHHFRRKALVYASYTRTTTGVCPITVVPQSARLMHTFHIRPQRSSISTFAVSRLHQRRWWNSSTGTGSTAFFCPLRAGILTLLQPTQSGQTEHGLTQLATISHSFAQGPYFLSCCGSAGLDSPRFELG
jgi:hypothetical protein